jgi:leader peptidase (prepilin peptidase)/N-methyltransferase
MLFSIFLMIIVGLCIGSFLNMLIFRLPRSLPIGFDRSRCLHCNHVLSPLELIPLLSFVFQKGRCRHCREKIPFRYMWCELLCGALWGWLFYQFGFSFDLWAHGFFFSVMIALFFIDLEHFLLPDKLTLPCIAIGLGLALYTAPITDHLLGMIAAAAAMGVIFAIGKLVYKQDVLGLGDIKLAATFGAFWGLKIALLSLYFSFLIGGVTGIILILLKLRNRKDAIPFGPAMILGCFVAVYWGERIMRWVL